MVERGRRDGVGGAEVDGGAGGARDAGQGGMLAAARSSLGGALLQRKVQSRLLQRKARAAPKKTATPAEVKAIQAVIDRALAAEAEAATIEAEAKALQGANPKDPKAHARELAADARRREARGLKQEAIVLAVAAYGVDITHVKSLLYDGYEDSETDDQGNVTIGKGAFTSPGELASTIAHESEVHVNQQLVKGRNYEGNEGRALNEVQAYDWEIMNAPRFGLTKEQVAGLRRNRAHYMEHLSARTLARRQHGDYSMEKGHEED